MEKIMDKKNRKLEKVLNNWLGKAAPAIGVEVSQCGRQLYSGCLGWLDPEEKQRPVDFNTQFDLASVSKLFTTVTFMSLVEQGLAALDQPVCEVLPAFSGLRPIRAYEDPLDWEGFVQPAQYAVNQVDASRVTFRHLLTHTSGLPAWCPLKDQADAASARKMTLKTPFFYPTGENLVYSDLGLILTGMAIEKLSGKSLDQAVYAIICKPLGLEHTRYLPLIEAPFDTNNIAPTEICVMRRRRVLGEVHDENAWRLGGVAGHAGVFSSAADLCRFGKMLLAGGGEILNHETLAEMTRLQAARGDTRRGIGFLLRSPDPESSAYALSEAAFGHTGFTGTSLWIDPQRNLVVALLCNRVYYGRDAAAITRLRSEFHRAVVEVIEG